jgi:transcription antitermination factor NusG
MAWAWLKGLLQPPAGSWIEGQRVIVRSGAFTGMKGTISRVRRDGVDVVMDGIEKGYVEFGFKQIEPVQPDDQL